MLNQKVGESSTESTTVPTVPGLSLSTVKAIIDRMARRGIRSQLVEVKAFYEDPTQGTILLTYNTRTYHLAWALGERPPLVEVIRSVEEIKAAKVAS